MHERELAFGGYLEGTLHIVNPQEERTFGELVVELVAHLPESKAFVEESFGEVAVRATLDPDQPFTIPFRLALPQTLAPGRELFLRARFNERTVALHEVRVAPRIICEIATPKSYLQGDQFTLRAVIRNTSSEPVRNVDVQLHIPYALQTDGFTHRRFEELQAYEAREVTWTVWAVAPLDSSSLRVTVASANAGSCVARQPFNVAGPEPQVDAQPAFFPREKRK